MAIAISPLDLLLDTENPRFVILQSREQADIRKYLVTYEDVCQLATDINTYGRLLPGERIVALHEGDKYVVVEGNRRTCSLQMLLNRELIPDGFAHRIPHTSASILTNCSNIEVDILYYTNQDHIALSQYVRGVHHLDWIISYDDAPFICGLYGDTGARYQPFFLDYTCASHVRTQGQELLISNLPLPPFPVANAAQM